MVAYQKTGPAVDLTEAQTGEEEPAGQYTPFEGIVIADALTGDPIIELDGFCLWYSGPPSSGVAIETEECEEPGMWRDEVLNASFSPDGSLLATTGVSGRLVVWDVVTGGVLWSDQEDEEQKPRVGFEANVSFSPDGRYLATSLYRFIAILEVGAFDSIAEFQTDRGGPSEMEWTPDGSRLVLNDQNLNVFVIDTTTWERVHTLVGQRGDWFPDIAVDPTGRFVATAGVDSESRIWDIETGTEVLRFSVPRTPFGLRNVVWVDEGTLVLGSRLWSTLMTINPVELVEASIERLTRSFTVEECATYGIDPCPTLEEIRTRS